MTQIIRFRQSFKDLTGFVPMRWQERLFKLFLKGIFPETCSLPTGLGKTSILAVWFLAYLESLSNTLTAKIPRRLVYVVNRRTIVDQATREAENIRSAFLANANFKTLRNEVQAQLISDFSKPLAISTLRGQFADNGEWKYDPAQPAIIIGTIDMIGSRLLFSSYGSGYRSAPFHAGLLGQDSLFLHDEAHLEPAFQRLLESVKREQFESKDWLPLKIMALTATSRESKATFQLQTEEEEEPIVRKRLNATKSVYFHPQKDHKQIPEAMAQKALTYQDEESAILIYVRTLEDVKKIADTMKKNKVPALRLTGTMRGMERDEMAKNDPIFARFMTNTKTKIQEGFVCLICTSAGEVGIDISADHLICDLTPLDSMVQRFGRVNRYGDKNAEIHIFHESNLQEISNSSNKRKPFEMARIKTLGLLRQLPFLRDEYFDASLKAIEGLPQDKKIGAFTPEPEILPTSDILFDAWAFTSISGDIPGRPPVADWLHGIEDWHPPETHIAWRKEVEIMQGDLLKFYAPDALIADFPIKPHELLRERTDRAAKALKELVLRFRKTEPEKSLNIWIVGQRRSVEIKAIDEFTENNKIKEWIQNKIVLLPPILGGFNYGHLEIKTQYNSDIQYDVSDRLFDEKEKYFRLRLWDEEEPPIGYRLVRVIDTLAGIPQEETEEGEEPKKRFWKWFVQSRETESETWKTAYKPQTLKTHQYMAETVASKIADSLNLEGIERTALLLAARWHDLGKNRAIWQRAIQNEAYPEEILAKSRNRMLPQALHHYRHEFGSISDVENDPEFLSQDEQTKDLILHLISAHHGRARPVFSQDESFDPNVADKEAQRMAREIPLRYARLQKRFGRWGLAYLESLLKASDVVASQSGNEVNDGGEKS